MLLVDMLSTCIFVYKYFSSTYVLAHTFSCFMADTLLRMLLEPVLPVNFLLVSISHLFSILFSLLATQMGSGCGNSRETET